MATATIDGKPSELISGQSVGQLRSLLERRVSARGVDMALRDFFRSHKSAGVVLPQNTRKEAQKAADERKRELDIQKRGEARQVVNATDNVAMLCHLGVVFLASISMVFNGFSGMVGLSALLNDPESILNTAAPTLPGVGDLRIFMRWFSMLCGFVIPLAVLLCGAIIGRLLVRPHTFCKRAAMFVGSTAVFILGVSVVHVAESIHLLTGASYAIAFAMAVGIDTSIIALEIAAVSVKITEAPASN